MDHSVSSICSGDGAPCSRPLLEEPAPSGDLSPNAPSLARTGMDDIDLDFHTIPFHGEDALVENHYVSKRSRSQKGILASLAQDAETRVSCYANAALRKDQRDDEILRFVDFWKRRTAASTD